MRGEGAASDGKRSGAAGSEDHGSESAKSGNGENGGASERPLGLSMLYSDPLASWPVGYKAACRPEGSGGLVSISDAKPFGGPNLRGAEPEVLRSCLKSLVETLGKGSWIEAPEFEEIEPGLFLAVAKARYGPRLGSREVVIIKADMSKFRLAPYHEGEREQWSAWPVGVKGWAERLPSAALIFNAGQYYPDRSHMGTLARNGSELQAKPHKIWKGFVVQGLKSRQAPEPLEASEAEAHNGGDDNERLGAGDEVDSAAGPVIGSGWAVIDEDTRKPDAPGPEAYATVIQSHMVIDRLGRVRVRDTDRLASRSALAIDHDENLWLVAVPGAISLYDLALLLKKLDLVAAIGLDGGLETQVALKSPDGGRIWLGKASNNFLGNILVEDLTTSLPAVISLERIEPPQESAGP